MILALDTSCYTTSVAIMDTSGRLICDVRRPLSVERGCRGLRQSEALFAHVRNLPGALAEAFAVCPAAQLTRIAVSTQPRPETGSYMPVFTAGISAAETLAAALRLPLLGFSHQEGHIAAALWSAGLTWQEPFLACHLSGGTGELLLVTPRPVAALPAAPAGQIIPAGCAAYRIEIIGDCDLPPGQFVDRVGVALGCDFPAGAALDRLADSAVKREFRLSGSVRDCRISFSGPETAAQRAVAAGVEPAEIAAAVFANIGKSLHKAIARARERYHLERVLLMGGVAASGNLRNYFLRENVDFAAPPYAGDNAVGLAALSKNIKIG